MKIEMLAPAIRQSRWYRDRAREFAGLSDDDLIRRSMICHICGKDQYRGTAELSALVRQSSDLRLFGCNLCELNGCARCCRPWPTHEHLEFDGRRRGLTAADLVPLYEQLDAETAKVMTVGRAACLALNPNL